MQPRPWSMPDVADHPPAVDRTLADRHARADGAGQIHPLRPNLPAKAAESVPRSLLRGVGGHPTCAVRRRKQCCL